MILNVGSIWYFGKVQNSPELISVYGAQRVHLLGLGASGP